MIIGPVAFQILNIHTAQKLVPIDLLKFRLSIVLHVGGSIFVRRRPVVDYLKTDRPVDKRLQLIINIVSSHASDLYRFV